MANFNGNSVSCDSHSVTCESLLLVSNGVEKCDYQTFKCGGVTVRATSQVKALFYHLKKRDKELAEKFVVKWGAARAFLQFSKEVNGFVPKELLMAIQCFITETIRGNKIQVTVTPDVVSGVISVRLNGDYGIRVIMKEPTDRIQIDPSTLNDPVAWSEAIKPMLESLKNGN